MTGLQFIVARLKDRNFHTRRQERTPLRAGTLLANDERGIGYFVDDFADLSLDLLVLRSEPGDGGQRGLKLSCNSRTTARGLVRRQAGNPQKRE